MHRKTMGIGAGLLLVVAAYGCGSSDSSVSSGSRDAKVHAAQSVSGMQTVEYQGVAFDVPADWPVYDLTKDPTMCVRFDVHAVYLGDPSSEMNCPAGRVGSTEAVLVQSIHPDTPALGDGGSGEMSAMDIGGLGAKVSDQQASMGQIQVDIGAVRASITTGTDGGTLARQILQSFRGGTP